MLNISDSTVINGFDGKRSTLQQAFSDRNLHRDLHYDYTGQHSTRGTVQLFLNGEWRTAKFHAWDFWARIVEVR